MSKSIKKSLFQTQINTTKKPSDHLIYPSFTQLGGCGAIICCPKPVPDNLERPSWVIE